MSFSKVETDYTLINRGKIVSIGVYNELIRIDKESVPGKNKTFAAIRNWLLRLSQSILNIITDKKKQIASIEYRLCKKPE